MIPTPPVVIQFALRQEHPTPAPRRDVIAEFVRDIQELGLSRAAQQYPGNDIVIANGRTEPRFTSPYIVIGLKQVMLTSASEEQNNSPTNKCQRNWIAGFAEFAVVKCGSEGYQGDLGVPDFETLCATMAQEYGEFATKMNILGATSFSCLGADRILRFADGGPMPILPGSWPRDYGYQLVPGKL